MVSTVCSTYIVGREGEKKSSIIIKWCGSGWMDLYRHTHECMRGSDWL